MTSHTDPLTGYADMAEAANILGVSRSQVSRYMATGKLEYIRVSPVQIPLAQLRQFAKPARGNPCFNQKKKR